jgi:hypothetical protein
MDYHQLFLWIPKRTHNTSSSFLKLFFLLLFCCIYFPIIERVTAHAPGFSLAAFFVCKSKIQKIKAPNNGPVGGTVSQRPSTLPGKGAAR